MKQAENEKDLTRSFKRYLLKHSSWIYLFAMVSILFATLYIFELSNRGGQEDHTAKSTIQELKTQVEQQERRIEQLEKKIEELLAQ